MTDHNDDDDAQAPGAEESTGTGTGTGAGSGSGEPTGALGDELARLVGGAQDWLRQNFELAGDAQAAAGAPNAHDGTVCGWCPLCQFVAVLRGDRPEVTEKVAQAGAAVTSALRALLDATTDVTGRPGAQGGAHRAGEPQPRVQRIDLGDPAADGGSTGGALPDDAPTGER